MTDSSPHNFSRQGWRWWLCRHCYAPWEPVIFRGGRRRTDRTELTVQDHLSENITLLKGLTGVKPESFCRWILDLLGYQSTDELVDLFPGSGVMGRVLAQQRLAM